MDEQNQVIESFISNVRVKRKRAAVSLAIVSLVSIVIGLSLLVYLTRQAKTKLDQVNDLENQLTEKRGEFQELKRETENAEAQLGTTKTEISTAVDKLKQIYDSPLPANAKTVLAEAISKLSGVETTVVKVETELKSARQPNTSESVPSRNQAISDLFSEQPAVRFRAYNAIMDNYGSDPALVPELLSYARAHTNNENGIYNTLVVLSHLNKAQLRPHVAEIQDFAKSVETTGPRIKDRVDKLLSRLPT
jgi:hypothetical protein